MGDNALRAEPRAATQDIERDIETLQKEFGDTAREIDRRRRELLDWRLQVRRNRKALLAVAGGITLLAAFGLIRKRRRSRPEARARRLDRTLEHIFEHPEALAVKRRGMAGRIARSLATGAAVALARPVGRRVRASLRNRTGSTAPTGHE